MPIFSERRSDDTRRFYDGLSDGLERRGLWGKENRFDPHKIAASRSVREHYLPAISPYITRTDSVLDLGCGPGGFLLATAPLCGKIIGADITPSFVDEAQAAVAAIASASAQAIEPGILPFPDASFDRVIMVDTIHHLEHADETMREVHRVLKPGGTLLVFEPNKKNPLLWLMCLLDKNEHGLLRLGTIHAYRNMLGRFAILEAKHSGLLIGPDSPLSLFLANVLMRWRGLAWLSPKLFLAARKL